MVYAAYISFTTEPFESLSQELAERKATQLANELAAQHKLTVEVTDAIRLADLEE